MKNILIFVMFILPIIFIFGLLIGAFVIQAEIEKHNRQTYENLVE